MNEPWSKFGGRDDNQGEACWLWFVGRDRQILGEIVLPGQTATVTLPLDSIARAIVGLKAVYLFMTHNHPSGDMRPSEQDIAATRQIWRTARAVGASLQDHYIVGRTGCFSFREHGLL